MKATANFYFDGQFYKAGTEVPKTVKDKVGKHLFTSESSESASKPSPAVAPQVKDPKTPTGDSGDAQKGTGDDNADKAPAKDEEYFSALNKEELVAEAKEAGITGKATKDELIAKLVEHHG